MNKVVPPPITAFYLTGQRSGDGFDDVQQMGLRPALFATYRELSGLRYDYPVVLIKSPPGVAFVRSLSAIIDRIIAEPPPGVDGGRRRKHLIRIETEIRTLSAVGENGTLLQLWDRAAKALVSGEQGATRKSLTETLNAGRRALPVAGEVIDCDADLPLKLMSHAWNAIHEARTNRVGEEICDLIIKLSNILKTDELASGEAHTADALRSSVGVGFAATFDFDALSDILGKPAAHACLPQSRRQRIHSVLSALTAQRFFRVPSAQKRKTRRHLHPYIFETCARALKAFRQQLPERVELVKAMATARLEIDNSYSEATHDAFFEGFDENALGAGDLAVFPPYLVALAKGVGSTAEKASFLDIIASGLPIKVLVQQPDILDDLPIEAGRLTFGVKAQELAGVALGLDGVYVLQSTSAYLYRLRDAVIEGISYSGPAVFSVFAAADGDLTPYLRAAAAVESRAFPTFVRNPASGGDWTTRFSLGANPQADADWPLHQLAYEDRELQRQSTNLAFTFADFVACDARYAEHIVGVSPEDWRDGMIPLDEFLDLDANETEGRFPYILMVDDDDTLHRAVVEDRLVEAARRCRDRWRSLQELAGANKAHTTAPPVETVKTVAPPPPEAETEAEAEAEAEVEIAPTEPDTPVDTDQPFIETPRCTTCNECTGINNKMFAYNDDQQAVIADPGAGTYRQMVEAAESCQVAIIHPGAPKNPTEPGLDDLVARAQPFL